MVNNAFDLYTLREARLASLSGDGAHVPLIELVEDVIHEARKAAPDEHVDSLEDLANVIQTLQSDLKDAREERDSALGDVVSLEEERDRLQEALKEAEAALAKYDEAADADREAREVRRAARAAEALKKKGPRR
jgi:uncharacterized coiled-coil DUF342 family protein